MTWITNHWLLLFGKTSIILELLHLRVQPIHVTAIGALGFGAGIRKAYHNGGRESSLIRVYFVVSIRKALAQELCSPIV